MRHAPDAHWQRGRHGVAPRHPQPPAESTPEKAMRYIQAAQQVAGVAHSIYQAGRFVAPYVASAAAVL